MSCATSGDPCFGFTSILKGENPNRPLRRASPSEYISKPAANPRTPLPASPRAIQRIDHADKRHLRHAFGILPAMLSNQLLHAFFIAFARQLNQEIARVHFEHAGQQIRIIHIRAVGGIAFSSRTSVDTDVLRSCAVKRLITRLFKSIKWLSILRRSTDYVDRCGKPTALP